MADHAKEIQLRELKDTILELNKLIRTLQQTIEAANKREEELRQERDNMKEQIDYLTKKLFGSSSEKGKCEVPGQMNLFNEAEAEMSPDLPAVLAQEDTFRLEETPVPKKKKARPSNEERLKGLPVEKVYLDVSEDKRICKECGTVMEKIGVEFVRRELEFIPAKVKVLEYYSVNYGCPFCKETRELPQIVKGKDGHPHMVHGMASASTVAWIMYQKYFNGMPLYRQEQDWKQCGVKISRTTFANWLIANADDRFRPMYGYLHRTLLKRSFAMADETPLQVLHEPERRAQTQSYMWLFRSGEDGEPPVILYQYSPTRAGDHAVDFLDGFSGYLMCDGYSGYNKIPSAKRTVCFAHIRRYLIDAIPKGKELDYSQPAVQGVMYINRLFELEKKIQQKYAGDYDAIRAGRLKKEQPVLEGFWEWLENQAPTKGSRMAKAVTYIRNRLPYMKTYLEDGRCSFTNNLSENSIRPFVVGRKGWLFSNTPAGAETSAIIYTMVETAKANGVNVYQYLKLLLERQPNDRMTDEEFEALAPWDPEVKAITEARATETPKQSSIKCE